MPLNKVSEFVIREGITSQEELEFLTVFPDKISIHFDGITVGDFVITRNPVILGDITLEV